MARPGMARPARAAAEAIRSASATATGNAFISGSNGTGAGLLPMLLSLPPLQGERRNALHPKQGLRRCRREALEQVALALQIHLVRRPDALGACAKCLVYGAIFVIRVLGVGLRLVVVDSDANVAAITLGVADAVRVTFPLARSPPRGRPPPPRHLVHASF